MFLEEVLEKIEGATIVSAKVKLGEEVKYDCFAGDEIRITTTDGLTILITVDTLACCLIGQVEE